MVNKKTIIVGVSSSIATFKSVQLVSDLLKLGHDVEVIMSENATQFVTPLTFSSLTKHKTYVHTFDREIDYNVEHISLAKRADLFILVPATANIIAKVAHGICDDMLSTTFLAAACPKLIAPAMNTQMLKNPITQDNIKRCEQFGMTIIHSEVGNLACGDVGDGKLASLPTILEHIEQALCSDKPLLGKRVLINAGGCIEAIDPVRYITNSSSGKMGYALARHARNLGADVTLVSAKTSLFRPCNVNIIEVESTQSMFDACSQHFDTCDYFIAAAAPSDFYVVNAKSLKIKKCDSLTLQLEKNIDILSTLSARKKHQIICGFAAETNNVLQYAREKFNRKNCDILIANDVSKKDSGFHSDTNTISILTKDETIHFENMRKEDVAKNIFDALLKI